MAILLGRVCEAWDAFLDESGDTHISLIMDMAYFCTYFTDDLRPNLLKKLSPSKTAELNEVKPIINQAIFESKKSFNGFALLK